MLHSSQRDNKIKYLIDYKSPQTLCLWGFFFLSLGLDSVRISAYDTHMTQKKLSLLEHHQRIITHNSC